MEAITIRPNYNRAVIIAPKKVTYFEEKGWSRNGNTCQGSYKTSKGTWRGIIEQRSGEWQYYIEDPPKAILHGEHQACFKHVGNNRWWIHWSTKPRSLSEGILNIERLIENTVKSRKPQTTKRSWWERFIEGG